MDLPFWQDVIAAPGCSAQTLVTALGNPRGRAHCAFDDQGVQQRCMSQSATHPVWLCGAGMDHVQRFDCMRLPNGAGDLDRALQCLAERRGRDVPRAAATQSVPQSSSRFRLQSEGPAPSQDLPSSESSLAELGPVSPGALDLTLADLADPTGATVIRRRARDLMLSWADATLAALPTQDQIARQPGLDMSTRLHAREILLEIAAGWTVEHRAACKAAAEMDETDVNRAPDLRLARAEALCFGRMGFAANGRVYYLITSAGVLFGLLDPD